MKTVLVTTGITKSKLTVSVLWVSLCGYLGINQELINLLGVAIILDVTFGVIRAKTVDHRDITSNNGQWGILRKLLIFFVPIICAIMLKGINIDPNFIVGAVIGLFILTECYSILGHLYSIITNKSVKEQDATALVLKAIMNGVLKLIKVKIDKINNGTLGK